MSLRAAERRLRALYRRVDRQVAAAGPVCTRSGRCCDFARSGLTLFATALETDLVLAAHAPPAPERAGACPFQRHGLCTMRALRPLGCRVYFCDPRYLATAMSGIAESAQRALRQIHEEHGVPYRYAPFLELLARPRPAPA
ncbi:MAG: hypothetical protein JXQ29_03895 [Planctomycetes bacterium]|nr:hypothetical protein [Planctomycetota bacterium]